MPGQARTLNFLLGTATVMVGDPEELWDLTPSQHSLGLVTKVSFQVEPTFVELSHGAPNRLVYSAQSGERSSLSVEAYEMSSQSMMYALGARPSTFFSSDAYPVTCGATTATFTHGSDISDQFPVGAWIAIQEIPPYHDKVHYAQLSAATSGNTLTFTGQPIKAGNQFSASARVMRVKEIPIGTINQGKTFVSVKIVGILPQNDSPIVLVMPKVRIVRGFQVSFQEGAFSRMNFEFLPHQLLPEDPMYSELGNALTTKVFVPKAFNGIPRRPENLLNNAQGQRIRLGGRGFIAIRSGA